MGASISRIKQSPIEIRNINMKFNLVRASRWYVSCCDEMNLNDGYGRFDFFMSNKRQIIPPQNNENRLKIWPFLTKVWLFECRCPSKCTSEKTCFKVKKKIMVRIIVKIRKTNHYKSVFQHVDVKSVLKLFKRYQIALAMVTKIVH